jgi:hypothetical protein
MVTEKTLLVDIDSAIPNLALMKYSTHERSRGNEVVLYDHRPTGKAFRRTLPFDHQGWPDRVVASCVFSWNAPVAADVLGAIACGKTEIGGTGVSLSTRLPDPVEQSPPDYSLYGEDVAIGFCNRGCFRKCDFCVVPILEGSIRQERFSHPSEWVPDGFSKADLLDNEFADYDPFTQAGVIEWFRLAGVKYCLTQGYDLRIIARNPGLADLLASNKPWDDAFRARRLYCAWDYIGNEPAVRKGIETLLGAGFRPKEITCYTIVGHRTTHEEDLHRFEVLYGEYGVHPFAMPFNNRKDDPWINAFARFINRRVFTASTWEDYARRPPEPGISLEEAW